MINKKELTDITIALNSGLVPRSGVEHIMVGREDLLDQFGKDLEQVSKGNSLTKFIIGKYGTGKSFVQASIAQKAYRMNMVVSKVDFSPFRRLYHRDGMAKALYTEIMKNLTTLTSTKNTIELIIESWIQKILESVAEIENIDIDLQNPDVIQLVEIYINKEIKKMDNLFGTSDFAQVLFEYFKAYISFDEDKQRDVVKWICAEYPNKTEAKRCIGVSNIIDDSNYYEFLKVICNFVVLAGFNGLVISFDEAVNLYKITQRNIRDKNYEMMLRIFNDTIQGDIQHLFITFGGTPQFLEDNYKGLYSYGALKRRLESNKYENQDFADYSQPVIKLRPLSNEEKFVLLKKILKIYEADYMYQSSITDDEIIAFLENNYLGIQNENVTIGKIIKDFVGAINILRENPSMEKSDIFESVKTTVNKQDILSRFKID